MKNTVRFIVTKEENGDIKGGKGIRDYLDGVLPGRWVVSIDRYIRRRGIKQNAYYHLIVVNYVRDGLVAMGFDASLLSNENVHEYLKNRFLKIDIANPEGEYFEVTRSTTELTTVEFMDYIAEIQKWATEFLGIYIPDPNQQGDMFS